MAQSGKKKWPVIAGVGFMLLVIGAMAWSTLVGNRKFECEVCMTNGGQTICRQGAGADRESAERVARDAACTDVGIGAFACQNAPAKVTWK